MKKIKTWLALGLFAAAGGCQLASVQPEGLRPLPAEQLSWRDDGPSQTLQAALVRSLCYYQRLDAKQRFSLGDAEYSPAQLAASLRLFWEAFSQAASRQEFAGLLAERFLVYESRSAGGEGLFTAYYEPEIAASPQPLGRLKTPLYARPEDLVVVDLRGFPGTLPSRTLAGRLQGGRLAPYETHRQIVQEGALEQQAQVLAYVNQVDLFFLQIQGSGVLRFADGTRMKVGYAASNGHPYRSLGAVMVRRGLLAREEVTLQSIRRYLREHPQETPELLYTNPSYVFFAVRDPHDPPLGNLALPLIPGRSAAADQTKIPPGALLYVMTTLPEAGGGTEAPFRRFMLAQDSGGAIQGHRRLDLFLGAGEEIEAIAGRMKHPGRLFVLAGRPEWLEQAPQQPACPRQAKP